MPYLRGRPQAVTSYINCQSFFVSEIQTRCETWKHRYETNDPAPIINPHAFANMGRAGTFLSEGEPDHHNTIRALYPRASVTNFLVVSQGVVSENRERLLILRWFSGVATLVSRAGGGTLVSCLLIRLAYGLANGWGDDIF